MRTSASSTSSRENPTTTAGEKEKYATYMHDGRTDLDYADQRYYATGAGRFMTADPAGSGLKWYAYVGGDPVNRGDPSGLGACRRPEYATTAPDPAGVCPAGMFYFMTDNPVLFYPPPSSMEQWSQNARAIAQGPVQPGVAWAMTMLGGNDCNALFNTNCPKSRYS